MKKITVDWFDKYKGFGEGHTEDDEIVYLHYSAFYPKPKNKNI